MQKKTEADERKKSHRNGLCYNNQLYVIVINFVDRKARVVKIELKRDCVTWKTGRMNEKKILEAIKHAFAKQAQKLKQPDAYKFKIVNCTQRETG